MAAECASARTTGIKWLWQVAQVGLLRCWAKKARAELARMTDSGGNTTVGGGGGVGVQSSSLSVNFPRDTGEVRLPREVAIKRAPIVRRPPRCGVALRSTRVIVMPGLGIP